MAIYLVKLMDKMIEALSELGECSGTELAKYLGRDIRRVTMDLEFLRRSHLVYYDNYIWHLDKELLTGITGFDDEEV
jgi:hypothetical protein